MRPAPARLLAATAAAGLLLVACGPVVMPAGPGDGPDPDFGPELVVDVINASDGEVPVAYEFDSGNAGGGGESAIPGCERSVMQFGDVAGTYEVVVAGTTVIDGQVPPGMPARGYLFARVQVDPDGTARLTGGPQWVATAPALAGAPVQGCG